MQDYVVGFMFSLDKEKVLLIQKEKPAWQKGFLNGVGGKIEPGETAYDAMCREFLEETGIPCRLWKPLVNMFSIDDDDRWLVHFYYTFDARITDYKQITNERLLLVRPTSIGQLLPTPIFNLTWLIPLALDKSVVKPLTVYEKLYMI